MADRAGAAAVGLGGLQPVRASPAPSPTPTAHGVQVAWSAARAERRGRDWSAARELVLERERSEIRVRDERGQRRGLLPDLAVWRRADAPPVAVVIEPGYRRANRQRAILKAWRDAIGAGQYAAVRYDCAGEQTAQRITRLAKKLRLGRSVFLAAVQSTSEEIAAIERQPQRQDQDQTTEHLSAAVGIDGQDELDEQEDSGGDVAVVVRLREPQRQPVKPPPAIRQPSSVTGGRGRAGAALQSDPRDRRAQAPTPMATPRANSPAVIAAASQGARPDQL